MNNQDEGNWNGGNFRIYIAQIAGKCICETFPPPLVDPITSPPMQDNPSWICPKKFVPTMKSSICFRGETLGLWCMQVDVHNTLFSWHVMFEEININFMNPHVNEIMQSNYAKMQKKLIFWKWIFFCLNFTIAMQQNTITYSEKTFPKQINTLFIRKNFAVFPRESNKIILTKLILNFSEILQQIPL